jgi:dimethylhistidine N-methyltransferase
MAFEPPVALNPVASTGVPLGRFLADIRLGLRASPKTLPCKYFYDAAGSELFAKICELDEYYLTRTELAIMQRHAPQIASLLGRNCLLIEYGSGSSVKTRLLLDHLREPAAYVPVDLSEEQLQHSAAQLARQYPGLPVLPLFADFTQPLELPTNGRASRRAVYFPGSTIGNFTPSESLELLRRTAQLCGAGGGLLLGADLKKDPAVLHAAYNDKLGVTAAFNLNLLVRINRELGADFQIDQFWHHAFYQPGESRIEMHLVSRCDQRVRLADQVFTLAEGESIRTEYSYKYSPTDLLDLAAASGFKPRQSWTDDRRSFVLQWFAVR